MFERLGPVETSNGRIAVLARRPAENREVFCDFVASRGREGPPSILATMDAPFGSQGGDVSSWCDVHGGARCTCGDFGSDESESEASSSLDEELGSHLRECKRIMGRMAEAEQPGERPAVIATLTWGAEEKGGAASVDIAYDQANPPTARFLKRVKMWTDTLGSA